MDNTNSPAKELTKKTVSDPIEIMSKVLEDQISRSSVNRGFRARNNTMFTYSQTRVGFNYFYCKRKILNDGIHTSPLDLVLSPWPDFNRHVFVYKPHDPLCNAHPFTLTVRNLNFVSVDHYLVFSLVKFHQGEEQASVVQGETTWSQIVKYKKDINVTLSWYVKLEELLEDVLNLKYDQCQAFKNSLVSLHTVEIVYADVDRFLGCGMPYKVAVLTPSQKYPGRNILGNILCSLKNKKTK